MRACTSIARLSILGFCIYLLLDPAVLAQSPPGQPASGPGSDHAVHGSYDVYQYGLGYRKYWLYEPADPKPASAPVLLYLHGSGALSPDFYEDMFGHFARRGFVVVYPRHGGFLYLLQYERYAIQAFENALVRLQGNGHVSPDLDGVVFAGHSQGGILALILAHVAEDHDYPAPRALVLHDLGTATDYGFLLTRLDDLSGVSSDAILVMISAGDLFEEGNRVAAITRAWNNTPQIPRQRKNLMIVPTDTYGDPDLVSDHLGVQAGQGLMSYRPLDAIDWWGYWRPTEAAFNAAIRGTDAEYALGDGPLVKDMGLWSDGSPVTPKITMGDLGDDLSGLD